MDVLSAEQRKLNMRSIKGRDTKPELIIRHGLHALGLRYRLHDAKLAGRPDLVFSKYKVAVFVHGCFWHGHNCPMFQLPATRAEFWRSKISKNRQRDVKAHNALIESGWRVLTVWECSLKGRGKILFSSVLQESKDFILGGESDLEISGHWENHDKPV